MQPSPDRHWMTALLASGDEASWAFVLRQTQEGQDFVTQRATLLREAQRGLTFEVMASDEGKRMAREKILELRHELAGAPDWERDDVLKELRRWQSYIAPLPKRRFDIARLKAIPLQDVVEGNGIPSGNGRVKYKCPLHHEKEASFIVYTTTNTYHCFGCQAHGDVIDYIQALHSVSFVDACKILTKST
jgi:hypothetical protein